MKSPVFQKVYPLIEAYKSRLEEITMPSFTTSPPSGGWSYSEVYVHIFDSSLLSLLALQQCLKGNGALKKMDWSARLLFLLGRFPPGLRLKAPSRMADRVKKEHPKEVLRRIRKVELLMDGLLAEWPLKVPQQKVKHPRLGFLNAFQWIRFIEIHLQHHLWQLDRIDRALFGAG